MYFMGIMHLEGGNLNLKSRLNLKSDLEYPNVVCTQASFH